MLICEICGERLAFGRDENDQLVCEDCLEPREDK